ncbi:NfeD family protein [Paenibacillus allorhizosphaerae]|uniref:Membrane protein YuaF n=1 Tax=Paenibacillus allorhizosphaerae TaxID=2849866 RepID=A0ABM8VEC1_9BACL|nr:NfeD family protein [Paenibacillus allorhizosphaerae]CAG7628472.1 putative membrane protein YuaF [Paenibacillus allorhizosphaerae]
MLELYWGLLITGALFAFATVLFGDLLGNALDGLFDFLSADALHWLQPMVLFSAITLLGGAGVLLTKYTVFGPALVLMLSILAAAASAVLIFFLYVKPMENSENSVAFSIHDLVGRIGEVTVPIPAKGCGEVLVRTGGGVTNQIAESFDGTPIEAGRRVVTVEVKDGTLFVSGLDSNEM